MSSFRIVNNAQEPKSFTLFTDKPAFKSKNRIVDLNGNAVSAEYNGSRYTIIAKRERHLSLNEKVKRVCLAILATIFSLGFALISKSIRELFTVTKESIRFGIATQKTNRILKNDGNKFLVPNPSQTIHSQQIPNHIDIRGTIWLNQRHLYSYIDLLHKKYPNLYSPVLASLKLNFFHSKYMNMASTGTYSYNEHAQTFTTVFLPCRSMLEDIQAAIKSDKSKKIDYLAYPLHVTGNHWALVFIDRRKRTVEYYDSMMTYGNHNEIITALQQLATNISTDNPKQPYQLIQKINKRLQPPGSLQCGPWMLYFLENRVHNPDVDFNQLDIKQAQPMIAKYRLCVQKDLLERSCLRDVEVIHP